MSVETMALVLHHSRASGTAKLVLLGIANHAGDGGAWPTVATLARYANTTERSVQRALGELVKLGEVAVHRQKGGHGDIKNFERPNRYDVLVACPIECDRSANHRLRSLPTAHADLWITGVTPVSPGDASVTRGVTPVSPGGVTPVSPKPSLEPSFNPGVASPSYPQTARAELLCSICSYPESECQRREPVSGHTFDPPRRLALVKGGDQ